jgi:hypothetical protein
MADSPLAERAQAMRLISEHEMGELFKVIGFATHMHTHTHTHTPMPMPTLWQAQGFAAGDRSHKL